MLVNCYICGDKIFGKTSVADQHRPIMRSVVKEIRPAPNSPDPTWCYELTCGHVVI